MNPLNIHSPHILSCTSIPDVFFDTYMLRANGEFLKVYLYLYRWCKVPEAGLSVSSIADKLSMTESDVCRALRYWQNEGLLRLETDAAGRPMALEMLEISNDGNTPGVSGATTISGTAARTMQAGVKTQTTNNATLYTNRPAAYPDSIINNADVYTTHRLTNNNNKGTPQTYPNNASGYSAQTRDISSVGAPAVQGNDSDKYVKPAYTMQQIQAFNEQTKDEQIFLVIEQYIGKPLSQNDMNTIIFFYERLGFSPALIEYLVEYCVGNEHRSLRYMEKVAISWAQAGVDSVEKAKRQTEGYSRVYYEILKAFGIHNRGPAATEADYIKKWTEQFGFSQSIILEACNRTMSKIHQPSFNYADKILEGWHNAKVHHIEDIQVLDQQFEQQRQADAAKNTQRKSADGTGSTHTAQKPQTSNRFHNFNQRTYNYSDLEQKLAKKRQTIPKT